ncbi:MAG: chorismate synthase [Candidatus Omnitrophica bacterium]|nr:chorismate synthase [Candidatus Omnitrophota bacterium]
MLRFLTAGESHGQALVGILEGFPKGVRIQKDLIDRELSRRQSGYGRGARMHIEKDKVQVLSGLRAGITLGSPISFLIKNKDKTIDVFLKDKLKALTVPRPAHADLLGFLKYQDKDLRNILERASARETAARVAGGSICKQFLGEFKIDIVSHVAGIGEILLERHNLSISQIRRKTQGSALGCIDRFPERLMIGQIKKAKSLGDTLGGVIEIVAEKVPPGLGSVMHWDRRLDSRLASALMSIPAIKAVEVGLGLEYARRLGSKSHDEILYSKTKGFCFKTNNAGGIIAGISTGAPIVLRIAMKPIATLANPLESVDINTKKHKKAPSIRSDVTAVTACGVVAESVVSFVLTQAFLEKFSSDSLSEIKRNYKAYLKKI